MPRQSLSDYLFLLGTGLIWGSQFMFIELCITTMPPLFIAASRLFIGVIALSVLLLFIREPKLREDKFNINPGKLWMLYITISLFEAFIPSFLINWGQQYVDSSVAALIIGSVPIFTIVFSALFITAEKWRLGSVLSVSVGFTGLLVLLVPDIQSDVMANIMGEIALIIAAMCFAISIILIKYLPTASPIRAVRRILLLASIPLLTISMIVDKPWTLQPSLTSVISLIVLGTLCSGFVYLLYLVLVKRTNPTFTSLTNFIVPLVGTFLGILVLGEQFKWYQGLALAIVILALLCNQIRVKT